MLAKLKSIFTTIIFISVLTIACTGSDIEQSIDQPAEPDGNLQNPSTNYPGAVITLERTPCFGTCPIYTVGIYGDGRVVYSGIDFVEQKGTQNTQIDASEVEQLVDFMLSGGYLELQDNYTNRNVTDMPSTITSLSVDGTTKRVDHYFGDNSAPLILRQIEGRIDLLAQTSQWTGVSTDGIEVVFGSISLRDSGEAVTLPKEAILTVRLEDISLADAPSVVIGEHVYTEVGQLPTFYDIAFNLYDLDSSAMYAISAEVVDQNGDLLYITDTVYSALTYGSGSWVDIELISLN